MALITIDEPRVTGNPGKSFGDHPVFRLGFRPFYLLAALFAAVSIPLWLAAYSGVSLPHLRIDINWHMHEMVHGFAIAVIIGFLYTAGRNWTGLWTPKGKHLAALAGLWLAGRGAMLFLPPLPAAVVDVAFLPLAAWPLYRVLARAGNKRNMFLIGLLALLSLLNFAFHGARIGWLDISTIKPIHASLFVIVVIESVIGGRVIPGFTANALPGVKPHVSEKLDRICLGFTAAACIGWVAGASGPLMFGLGLSASCAQLFRLIGWKPHRTVRKPLLWILHLSYAWIAAGFFLLALAGIHAVSASAAVHVLVIGSMAGLIIGMITRTALGHTGRKLETGWAEPVMYLLLQAGVVARLVAAIDALQLREPALGMAAACWSAAFLLYVVSYGPFLMRPRTDGREG
ncbi:NnrS family protein [Noviherbaspirillum galbum]|uniref:NnrS family protein n=1 Tax=Noviherbaspirillum galbum TaxID=2709383 RepID=A0A6B3SNI3_9BURK|nr:NnrS family protein [Noviherbaspirillum galbum]NEX62277.1 NnrS family protein [Noviherbaspirillum galbum]